MKLPSPVFCIPAGAGRLWSLSPREILSPFPCSLRSH